MVDLKSKINEFYNKYKEYPFERLIIRNNQVNDAFVLLVAKLFFKDYLFFYQEREIEYELCKYIVAPPDNGIDIFLEEKDQDEFYYHIVQVKNQILSESEINDCFANMKRTINSYCKNPRSINNNLKEVINKTNFMPTYKRKCKYYVVHTGKTKYIKSQNFQNEIIISKDDIEVLLNSITYKCIRKETINLGEFNEIITYQDKTNNAKYNPTGINCFLNGYQLAMLNNKYSGSEAGLSLLYSQNFRYGLGKKSKTFYKMKETIEKAPGKFWYYNNGITIVADKITIEVDQLNKNQKKLVIEKFSITNGCQTVSTLGEYLREIGLNGEKEKINNLKKIYVQAKIVEAEKQDKFRTDIAIYNNSQNPISSRDMVSNRDEQIYLHNWLLNKGEPRIFVETKKGQKLDKRIRLKPHQITTNEILAQLAFSSFFKSPFKSKDKKRTLFNNTSQDNYIINEDYHSIFNYNNKDITKCGILFQKNKDEINELLFIVYIYNQAKKYLNKDYKQKIKIYNCKINESPDDNVSKKSIDILTRQIEINNVCQFYNICLYYMFKEQFDKLLGVENKRFKINEFYNNTNGYGDKLISRYATIFLQKTIELIKNNMGETNSSNWIRSPKSQTVFLDSITNELLLKTEYKDIYSDFVEKFKA